MCAMFEVEDILNAIETLTVEKQKELLKQLAPKFCELMMNDKTLMQEIMPTWMDMIQTMNFPMNPMMATMMGKS